MKGTVALVIILLLGSCGTPLNNENSLPGTWKVKWENEGNNEDFGQSDMIPSLVGIGFFYENGEAVLTGYGHQQSVFIQDTVTTSMIWKADDEQLILTNKSSNIAMQYRIVERNKLQWKCRNDEGIALSLSRIKDNKSITYLESSQ